MEDHGFKIRSYGFGELAQLYLPDITPKSASNSLRNWISKNAKLKAQLHSAGYFKGQRILSPAQVRLLIEHLGEP